MIKKIALIIIEFLAFQANAQKADAEIYSGNQLKYIGMPVGGINAEGY